MRLRPTKTAVAPSLISTAALQYQSEVKNPAYAPAVHELDKWIAETAAI
jgi:hypothetical protein